MGIESWWWRQGTQRVLCSACAAGCSTIPVTFGTSRVPPALFPLCPPAFFLHPLASAGRVDPSRLGVSVWKPRRRQAISRLPSWSGLCRAAEVTAAAVTAVAAATLAARRAAVTAVGMAGGMVVGMSGGMTGGGTRA